MNMAYEVIIGRDEGDKKIFGDRGLIYLGKGYVKMGNYTSLSNTIKLDVARTHVMLIAGKRGSGKSYTLGAIAEELSDLPKEVSSNIAPIIFDTMGIFWTMKYKNEKEPELLEQWDLKAKNLPVKVFAPKGYFDKYLKEGIPVDEKFALAVSELNAEDWVITFKLDMIHPVSVIIQRTITALKEKENYDIQDIIDYIKKDTTSSQENKNATIGLFEAAETWGLFSEKGEDGTKISDIINRGMTSVIDLSVYNSVGTFNVRALVIGLLCRKLFDTRMLARKAEEVESVYRGIDYLSANDKRKEPLVWIFIDEAHEFLPLEGSTAASDALIQLLREGRQPGISLVLATQQPGQIHRDAMTQADVVIAHRVTAEPDVKALNYIMQSYLLEGIKKYMDDLPTLKGSAILLDDNSERIYPIRVRPRFTWHGGEAPTAIKVEKRI